MFVLKRPTTKKIIIFFGIIFAMVAGTIFMLYHNQRLTIKNSSIISQKQSDNIADDIAEPKISSTTDQNKALIIDTAIFKNRKYQEMNDNSVLLVDKIKAGKRNPFEPYK